MAEPETLSPWGKRGLSGGVHHLAHHCADVAACFLALADEPLIRRAMERAAGRALDAWDLRRLAAVVFLHDLGKLSSGFQHKWRAPPPLGLVGHTREAWGLVRHHSGKSPWREILAALRWPELLRSCGGGTGALMLAALAHHGRPFGVDETGDRTEKIWRPCLGYDPLEGARVMGEALAAWLPEALRPGAPAPDSAPFQHLFAGLTALADQVGSREESFPFVAAFDPEYFGTAQKRAHEAVAALGLSAAPLWEALRPGAEAQALFGFDSPKPMQCALRDAPLDRRLLVLESETGSGKTEAAFLRFQRLYEAGEVDAIYFALPTRAAAVQIHRRIDRAAKAMFGADPLGRAVLAVPGYMRMGEAEGRALPDWRVLWDDARDQGAAEARWAAEAPRRYLAAPVAVGTIDQALMSALTVKWAHFRAATLARAFLVIDEVHASDAYMSEILGSLLETHLDLGGHALLMSATLGAAARRRWLLGAPGAVTTPPEADCAARPYPSLSFADGRQERLEPLTQDGRRKSVSISSAPDMAAPDRTAIFAAEQARAGAKVLIIRNTVRAALETLEALEALQPPPPLLSVEGAAVAHHSRFAPEDRRMLDEAVEQAIGKTRGEGGLVVVGTQTLEQSLDIDADVLITDLCPVDVLLQRIGRLHRHDRARPAGYEAPRCVVLTPERLAPGLGLARWGLGPGHDGGGVYPGLAGLEATRRLIEERSVWAIPADNRLLVEAATHPDTLDGLAKGLGDDWKKAHEALYGKEAAKRSQARIVRLDRTADFEDLEFPDMEEAIRTRLSEESLMIDLPAGTPGAFAPEVRRVMLPHALAKRLGEEGRAAAAASEDLKPVAQGRGFRLRLGPLELLYDRKGLQEVKKD